MPLTMHGGTRSLGAVWPIMLHIDLGDIALLISFIAVLVHGLCARSEWRPEPRLSLAIAEPEAAKPVSNTECEVCAETDEWDFYLPGPPSWAVQAAMDANYLPISSPLLEMCLEECESSSSIAVRSSATSVASPPTPERADGASGRMYELLSSDDEAEAQPAACQVAVAMASCVEPSSAAEEDAHASAVCMPTPGAADEYSSATACCPDLSFADEEDTHTSAVSLAIQPADDEDLSTTACCADPSCAPSADVVCLMNLTPRDKACAELEDSEAGQGVPPTHEPQQEPISDSCGAPLSTGLDQGMSADDTGPSRSVSPRLRTTAPAAARAGPPPFRRFSSIGSAYSTSGPQTSGKGSLSRLASPADQSLVRMRAARFEGVSPASAKPSPSTLWHVKPVSPLSTPSCFATANSDRPSVGSSVSSSRVSGTFSAGGCSTRNAGRSSKLVITPTKTKSLNLSSSYGPDVSFLALARASLRTTVGTPSPASPLTSKRFAKPNMPSISGL